MKRRDAFKKLSLFVYGSLTIPASTILHSCSPSSKEINWVPKYLNLNEAFFLTEVSNVVIPNTEFPGALAVGVPSEIEEYIFNVKEEDEIQSFRKELNEFEKYLNNLNPNKSFYESSLEEKTKIFNSLQKNINEKIYRDIYMSLKSSIATSYFRSEVGATKVLKYNGPSVVLGSYKGCIPFEEVGKTWAI